MTSGDVNRLATTRTVARSTLWNILGRAGPLLVAIAVTPWLVDALGPSRWGVFTIALSLVGIFGIFDFGIGRALTRMIAERVGAGRDHEAAGLVKSGLAVLTALGGIGGIVVALLARGWTDHLAQIQPELRDEVCHAIYVLTASAPLVLLNSALWGVIAAYQRFRPANLVNIPVMAMYYIGPLISLHFFNSLVGVMVVLVGCRIVMTVAYWRIASNAMPSLRHARIRAAELPPLFRTGGWMTVSNVIYPLLTYVDRFVIASVLSAAATGYYSTPSDLVARFSVLTIAVMNAVYPAMAASFRVNPGNTARLFKHALVAIAAALFLPCLCVTGFSTTILTVWLGGTFASHAAVVLSWLGFGIFIASLDSVAAGLLDGIGRPDISAKLSIVELVIYIPLLTVMVRSFGIEGAAMAWTVRTVIDFIVRTTFVARLYTPVLPVVFRLAPLLAMGLLLLAVPLLVNDTAERLAVGAGSLIVFALLLNFRALDASERGSIIDMIRKPLGLQRTQAL